MNGRFEHVDIRADDVPDGINAADHAAGLSSSLDNLAASVERRTQAFSHYDRRDGRSQRRQVDHERLPPTRPSRLEPRSAGVPWPGVPRAWTRFGALVPLWDIPL
jgi:hypothetical protein